MKWSLYPRSSARYRPMMGKSGDSLSFVMTAGRPRRRGGVGGWENTAASRVDQKQLEDRVCGEWYAS